MKDVDKSVIDLGAIGVTTGALFEVLPSITALASLVWVLLRIYETETVQKLFKKQQDKNMASTYTTNLGFEKQGDGENANT